MSGQVGGRCVMRSGTEADGDYRLEETGAGFSFIRKTRAKTNPVRHFHDWWEILFIDSGERTFFYGSRTFHIGAGTFLCIRPGTLHRALNPPDEVCSLYNVYFSNADSAPFRLLEPLLEACAAEPVFPLPSAAAELIAAQFAEIGRELREHRLGAVQKSWGLLYGCLADAARAAADYRAGSGAVGRLYPQDDMNKTAARIIDYLNVSFREPVSLQTAAARFGLSECHIARLLRKETRFSFVEYVHSLRVTEACRLLTTTAKNCTEIADACGFGSITQFGRVFRKHTGCAPREYRAARKNGR